MNTMSDFKLVRLKLYIEDIDKERSFRVDVDNMSKEEIESIIQQKVQSIIENEMVVAYEYESEEGD